MTISKVPMWNEVDTERDPDYREIEAQVELRMHSKRLIDCSLPEGFTLITPQPRQFVLDTQLRWAFRLRYDSRDGSVHTFTMRYMQEVSEEMQMGWAVQDFIADLKFRGVKLGDLTPMDRREEGPRLVQRKVA